MRAKRYNVNRIIKAKIYPTGVYDLDFAKKIAKRRKADRVAKQSRKRNR